MTTSLLDVLSCGLAAAIILLILAVNSAESRQEDLMKATLFEAEINAAAQAVYVPGVPPAILEASYYDPIIGVSGYPGSGMSESAALLRDMFYLYQERRTRSMATQMRQMRRYR